MVADTEKHRLKRYFIFGWDSFRVREDIPGGVGRGRGRMLEIVRFLWKIFILSF
jgi:hypothetical protein